VIHLNLRFFEEAMRRKTQERSLNMGFYAEQDISMGSGCY